MSTDPEQPAASPPVVPPQPPPFSQPSRPSQPAQPRPRPHPRVRNERALAARARTSQDRISDAITAFAGSLPFVYLHAAWFTIWILLNKGVFGDAAVFDPYPFGLLTMIVSLEAIFLSTFVMISQNRQAAREDIRADLDFETNLRSEVWSVHIGKALGLDAEAIERHATEVIAASKAAISRGETSTPQVTAQTPGR